MKRGDKVRFKVTSMNEKRIRAAGIGTITKVYAALGPVPVTYSIDKYKWRVLFPDEVKPL